MYDENHYYYFIHFLHRKRPLLPHAIINISEGIYDPRKRYIWYTKKYTRLKHICTGYWIKTSPYIVLNTNWGIYLATRLMTICGLWYVCNWFTLYFKARSSFSTYLYDDLNSLQKGEKLVGFNVICVHFNRVYLIKYFYAKK